MAYEAYYGSLPRLSDRFEKEKEIARLTSQRNIESKKEQDASEFNWGNALVRATSAMMAAGGPTNPMAWVAAGTSALGSERGKEFKPLESVTGGVTSGLTAGQMPGGGDLVQTLGQAVKPENLGTTLPFLQTLQPGADSMKILGDLSTKKEALAKESKLQTIKAGEQAEARKLAAIRNPNLTGPAALSLASGEDISTIASKPESFKVQEIKPETLLAPFKKELDSIITDPNKSVWDKYSILNKGDIANKINELPPTVQDDASKAYKEAVQSNIKEISSNKTVDYLNSILNSTDSTIPNIENSIRNDKYLTSADKANLYNKIDDKRTMSKRELRQEQQSALSNEKYLKAQERADIRATKQDERALKSEEKTNKMFNLAEERLNRQERETVAKRRLTDDYSRAVQGLTSIDRAMETYIKNPGVANIVSVPGRKFGIGEAGKFETDLRNAQDILMRVRTGAAIGRNEGKLYDKITNPQWFNDPENRLNKMQTLKDIYAEIIKRIEDPYRTPVNIQNILNKSNAVIKSTKTGTQRALELMK